MITLLRREFVVKLPPQTAWRCLARVEQWPSWAGHITRVAVHPPGDLGPRSTGHFHLRNGIKCAFSMTEFNPYRNWKWTGQFLWLAVHYDHIFEELQPTQTRLTWTIESQGFGASTLGKLFAKLYSRSLDRAIPALVKEMNAFKD